MVRVIYNFPNNHFQVYHWPRVWDSEFFIFFRVFDHAVDHGWLRIISQVSSPTCTPVECYTAHARRVRRNTGPNLLACIVSSLTVTPSLYSVARVEINRRLQTLNILQVIAFCTLIWFDLIFNQTLMRKPTRIIH